MTSFRRPLRLRLPFVPALIALFGCSGDAGVEPNPDVAFLVGDWRAVRFEVTVAGEAEPFIDLIGEGASFTLNVQPSGQYTAILTVPGFPPSAPEIGILSIEGGDLLFRRTSPSPEVTTRTSYQEVADGHVRFAGPSELDLDGDGTAEELLIEVEILRQ